MFIDTHCHLNDPVYTDKDQIVNNYLSLGVEKVINIGYDLPSSIMGEDLAKKYESVYFAVGFHPSDADKVDDNALKTLERLSKDKKCVAIGEIGLDYHYTGFDKEVQKSAFIKQLELANILGKPVIIHSRDACLDTMTVLKENKSKLNFGGIMHCFSGSIETAKELIDLGFYIGFGGPLTYKNSTTLRDVASFVPLEKCMTETDSPYLPPASIRGQTNEPKSVVEIAEKLALIKGITVEELQSVIENNVKTLFKI